MLGLDCVRKNPSVERWLGRTVVLLQALNIDKDGKASVRTFSDYNVATVLPPRTQLYIANFSWSKGRYHVIGAPQPTSAAAATMVTTEYDISCLWDTTGKPCPMLCEVYETTHPIMLLACDCPFCSRYFSAFAFAFVGGAAFYLTRSILWTAIICVVFFVAGWYLLYNPWLRLDKSNSTNELRPSAAPLLLTPPNSSGSRKP